MNRVLPVVVALLAVLVAVLVIVAPAAGAESVSIPDRTVSPGETVEITPEHENVRALRITDIPGDWGVSIDGDLTDTYDANETTEAKWVEPGANASLSLTIPDSASGTYDLHAIAFTDATGDAIEETVTITVDEATGAREADANLTSGASYGPDTVLAFEANASATTWGIYRVPADQTYLRSMGEVHLDDDGTGLIDLADRDLPPGTYAVGPSVYQQRRFEDGVAQPLEGDDRAAFSAVEQSLDAGFAPARIAPDGRTTLQLRSNVTAYDVTLTSETLSAAQLQAIAGGERTTDGVELDGGRNRSIPTDFEGIEPGRHRIRVTSTVGPAHDTAVVEVADRSTGVDAYRALEPPADVLSPSAVMTARGDYVAGEIDLETAVAVLRAFFFE